MRRLALDAQYPAPRGATRDTGGVHALVLVAAFERQCVVGALAHGDHVDTGHLQRHAGAFLVAGEHDLDVGMLKRAHALERAQCLDHDDVAPFHVIHALAPHPLVEALPKRHGTALLEHRVQMPEQEHALARTAFVCRDQVPRTLHSRRHVDPASREAQSIQFGPIYLAHGAHAFGIQGATVDAHRFLQQLQRRGCALLDGSDDPSFCLRELRMSYPGQKEKEGGARDGSFEHRLPPDHVRSSRRIPISVCRMPFSTTSLAAVSCDEVS